MSTCLLSSEDPLPIYLSAPPTTSHGDVFCLAPASESKLKLCKFVAGIPPAQSQSPKLIVVLARQFAPSLKIPVVNWYRVLVATLCTGKKMVFNLWWF